MRRRTSGRQWKTRALRVVLSLGACCWAGVCVQLEVGVVVAIIYLCGALYDEEKDQWEAVADMEV